MGEPLVRWFSSSIVDKISNCAPRHQSSLRTRVLQAFEAEVFLISPSWNDHGLPLAVEFAESIDEFCRVRPIFKVGWCFFPVHSDVDIEPNFKMQVGGVHSEVVANGADLLAFFDQLAVLDHDLVEVAIERVAEFDLPRCGVSVCVPSQDHVAPARPHVVREGYNSVRNGVDRRAEIGVSPSSTVPIFSKMLRGAESKTTSFIVSRAIWFADGKIKTVREVDFHLLRRRRKTEK